VGNLGLVAVDDLGELLEGGALGLNVHEVDEDKLKEDPALFSSELALLLICQNGDRQLTV